MPETMGYYSHWEPEKKLEPYQDVPLVPRLFLTKQAATNAKTAWLQGVWGTSIETESHGWEYSHLDFDYRTTPYPTGKGEFPRRKEDVEVVEAFICINQI